MLPFLKYEILSETGYVMEDTISLWQLFFPLVFSNLSTSPLLLVPSSYLFFFYAFAQSTFFEL